MKKSNTGMALLALGALGVVFGDIGTSPLYVFLALFGNNGHGLTVNQVNIHGVLSLIIWSIIIVVTFKYIFFLMRASNEGEGGIIALVALVKKSLLKQRSKRWLILVGVIGVSLFYGDSAITPAISVLSAVEGMNVIATQLHHIVVPVTITMIVLLFGLQHYGTSLIGKLFGPVMLIWFMTIGIAGGWHIWQNPDILMVFSPIIAINFVTLHPGIAFISMTAVILSVTGAEALYADMGHFGRPPIARAWLLVVLPALLLCYVGQGAVLLSNPNAAISPFYSLFPSGLLPIVVVLATLATLIASQSVISGAFSLTRQAVQLGLLPNMLVRHTSDETSGQIYVPIVNTLLFIAVISLVVVFGSSASLANAYGVAISGALLIDTILFIAVVLAARNRSLFAIVASVMLFLPLEVVFVTSNIPKVMTGGWFPIVIAIVMTMVITTWMYGQAVVARRRRSLGGPLQDFITKIHSNKVAFRRVPGQAVYIAHHPGFAPVALHASVDRLQELHEQVMIVAVNVANLAHVPVSQRIKYDQLKYTDDGISYVEITYGYYDTPNVPRSLETLNKADPEFAFDEDNSHYFISLAKVIPADVSVMAKWRRALYLFMERNRRSSSDYLHLPIERTIDIETPIEV